MNVIIVDNSSHCKNSLGTFCQKLLIRLMYPDKKIKSIFPFMLYMSYSFKNI